MTTFSSSRRFVSSVAILVSAAVLSAPLGCSAIHADASDEDVGGHADMAAALEQSSNAVSISDPVTGAVWEQTVSLEGVTTESDPEGHPVIRMANGQTLTVLEQRRLLDGRTFLSIRNGDGQQFSVSANLGSLDANLQPKAIHVGVAVAIIAAVVIIAIATGSYFSHQNCMNALREAQRNCLASGPNYNFSGQCTGGGWRDGWMYTLVQTCSHLDPRTTTQPTVPLPSPQPAPSETPADGAGDGDSEG